jgi:hypothetical protein
VHEQARNAVVSTGNQRADTDEGRDTSKRRGRGTVGRGQQGRGNGMKVERQKGMEVRVYERVCFVKR